MSASLLFVGNVSGNSLFETPRFSNAVGFWLNVPVLAEQGNDLSVDVFLNTFNIVNGREFRRIITIGQINEFEVLNATNTQTIITIPEEYLNTNAEHTLVFSFSESLFIELYIIQKNFNLEDELQQIRDTVEQIRTVQIIDQVETVALFANQLAQNAVLTEFAIAAGVALSVPTAGASLALPATVGGTLAPTTAGLSTALLLGGGL